MTDETTRQILIRVLKENGLDVFEDPEGSWWVDLGQPLEGSRSNVSISLDSLELSVNLKMVELKKKYFRSGDN